jgi:hypothetical protein
MTQGGNCPNVWDYFHKTNATVMDGHRQYYASCLLCHGAPTPDDLKEYDSLSRLSGRDKKSEADRLGLLIGKTVSLWRHLKSQCEGADEMVKRMGAVMCSTIHQGSGSKRIAPESSDDVTVSAARPPARRRVGGRIPDYAVGGSLAKYPYNEHRRVVSEFMAVHNVSANAMASEKFRNLQSYYCSEEDAIKRNNLLLTRPNLRVKYLPHRYNMALTQGQRRLGMSTFTALGYSFSCDGWASRQKSLYEGWCVTRPGTEATTVAIRPVCAAHLHATAIARDWESVILEASKPDGDLTTLEGFFSTCKEGTGRHSV